MFLSEKRVTIFSNCDYTASGKRNVRIDDTELKIFIFGRICWIFFGYLNSGLYKKLNHHGSYSAFQL